MLPGEKNHSRYNRRYFLRLVPIVLVLASLACALPVIGQPNPTQTTATFTPTTPPTPTPTPLPLPPSLVESNPPQNAEVPLQGPLTLYFNQPMDRASVEAALTSQFQQQLNFTWVDNSTVVVYLSAPLPPEKKLAVNFGDEVRSSQGKPLFQTVNLNFSTAGYLRLAQMVPNKDAKDIDPTAAVIAGFNRPIVPLGADPASLSPAFTLDPAVKGRGEWINTSTYIFYPEPGMQGGKVYTAKINPDLKSTDGGPLQDAQSWSFTTVNPQVLSIEPSTEIPWRLNTKVVLTFNQPVDSTSVESNFSLVGPNGSPVSGKAAWDENTTVFTYTLSSLLARNTAYTLSLNGKAQARGGTTLGDGIKAVVQTVPALSVTKTDPAAGGSLSPYRALELSFSAPIQEKDLLQYITIDPPVTNLYPYWDDSALTLRLNGDFAPSTSYQVNISPNLPDAWGDTLGQEFQLNFNSAPLPPEVLVNSPGDAIFITPKEPSLTVQAANLPAIPLTVGSVSLKDFVAMFGPQGSDLRNNYQSADQQSWTQSLDLTSDRIQSVPLYLSPDKSPLNPGIYFMHFNTKLDRVFPGPYLIVDSNIQTTFKMGATDALVWAVDLRTKAPLANAPVTIYSENGDTLASGQTDQDGVYTATFSPLKDPYTQAIAVISQPGQDNFGIGLSNWSLGITPSEFGLSDSVTPPGLKTYFYTDRPIYRPGQTVYFRVVARQAFNGRYTPPGISSLPITLSGAEGQELTTFDLPLSGFGTAHGEYTLPDSANPGYYWMTSPNDQTEGVGFQVANYRKPEINLQVSFASSQAQAGDKLKATVNARYFFDAPAGNLPVHWALYGTKSNFTLPGYQVGPEDTGWLDAFHYPSFQNPLGDLISEGDAKNSPDGTLALEFPTELNDSRMTYTLEATVKDESGLPVSARDSLEVNPDTFYIGVRPDAWNGRAGEQMGFEVQAVEWNQIPTGTRSLRAEFQKVVWTREDPSPPPGDPLLGSGQPKFKPVYTPVGSTDFTTSPDGKARLAFTPSEPGTYQLDIFDAQPAQGKGTRTQILLWVGGPGEAIWPNIPNSRMRLIADKDAYLPGDTAQIFIPNTFGTEGIALIAVERGTVMRHQVVTLGPDGYNLSLPLSSEDSPNVYLSVTLLGQNAQGNPDFRQGYLNLMVKPIEQTLKVSLTSQPERAGPGGQVTFGVLVTDAAGKPVQGEFSLAVVDLAALALADPNSSDIVTAFYGKEPDGVRTSLSLAAYDRRQLFMPQGLGGGGGSEAPSVVREHFPDTAYWNAEIVTGPDGKAQVNITLPDTLTTWQVNLRGLSADTHVGEAQSQIITTKELLIRPVTPRFLVLNDHVQLAAIIQNNTNNDIQAQVTLQSSGVALDDPATQTQQVSIPAQSRKRVEWWGTAQDAANADLVFSVQGKDSSGNTYQDATRPDLGALPIQKYVSMQTFSTSGALDEGGQIQELVSLPRSYKALSGELNVELSPSLAATMLQALDALDKFPYDSTEQVLSSFLPNLEIYRTLQKFSLDDPALKARLDHNLNQGLQQLQARQNPDGGWGWWKSGGSDPYITSYVLFGLSQARDAGISINLNLIQNGVKYLKTTQQATPLSQNIETWQLDRAAFEQFVLAQIGEGQPDQASTLYQARNKLSPWAQSLLALALERMTPGSAEASTLISGLEASAIRSATGAHWEMSQDESGGLAAAQNMQTTLSNSAIVLYALAQRDPKSPLVADAERYLVSSRGAEGAWLSTYTTAWSLVALDEVMNNTGEMSGNFAFSASINGNPLAQGQATENNPTSPVTAQLPQQRLYPDYPNTLVIQRDPGQGRLFYTAALLVGRQADQVTPLAQGLNIERAFYPTGQACTQNACKPIQAAKPGDEVTVRLTLTLPNDMYYLGVEDYIPAGAEILDTRLKTTQIGEGGGATTEVTYDPRHPFAQGWGWEMFNEAQLFDDHISWTANYLPAGTYELIYTLVILQPGKYQVMPAHAWQLYFPEVQANSAGASFEIKP